MADGLLVIADDEPMLRDLYSQAFRAKGFTVIAVGSGLEAINLLGRTTPRLLILDVNMPEMDGIETCRRARGLLGPSVPILFLTVTDGMEILHECMKAGGNDFLIKGQNIGAIVERVEFWSSRALAAHAMGRNSDALSRLRERLALAASAMPLDGGSDASPEIVERLRPLLNDARRIAKVEFGQSSEQQTRFLGYVSGMLDLATAGDFTAKPRFWQDLMALLERTGALENAQFRGLLDGWDKTAGAPGFRAGVNAAHEDFEMAERQAGTMPLGLVHLMEVP